MKYLNYIGLENFKVFKNKSEFELKPITILTGANSSGKSSLTSGISVARNIANGIKVTKFGDRSNVSIKNTAFLNFITKQSQQPINKVFNFNSKNKEVIFTLPFIFGELLDEFQVEFSYKSDEQTIENAVLSRFRLLLKSENLELLKVEFDKKAFSYLDFEEERVDVNFVKLRQLIALDIYRKLKYARYMELMCQKLKIDRNGIKINFRKKEFKSLVQEMILFDQEITKKMMDNRDYMNNMFERDWNRELHSCLFFSHSFLFDIDILLKNIDDNATNKILDIIEIDKKLKSFNLLDRDKFLLELIDAESRVLEKCFNSTELYNKPLSKNNIIHPNLVNETFNCFYSIGRIDFLFFKFLKILIEGERDIVGVEERDTDLSFLDLTKMFINSRNEYEERLISDKNFKKEDLFDDKFFIDNGINENTIILDPTVISSRLNNNYATNSFELFKDYYKKGVLDGFNNLKNELLRFTFIPNIRSHQQRLMFNNGNDYFSNVIFRALNSNLDMLSKGEYVNVAREFLVEYLNYFEIAEDFEIIYNDDALTASLFFFKDGMRQNIMDLGYGISQVLPILLELACCISAKFGFNAPSDYTFIIEEPETNLHPSLQSKLADLIVYCQQEFKINFIVETHSEYLIRKIQYLIAKNKINYKDVKVYYFNKARKDTKESEPFYAINFDEFGTMDRPFGEGFFDESEKIAIDLFMLNSDRKN